MKCVQYTSTVQPRAGSTRLQQRAPAFSSSSSLVPTVRHHLHRKPARQRAVRVAAVAMDGSNMGVTATYAALGLGALSFVGTFFVIPQFKDYFKEPLEWKEIYTELVSRGGVKTVSAREAYDKTRRGGVLLDVRLARKHEESRPEGSVSVPLYLPIQKYDLASNLRRAGFAFFGIYGTELNTNFEADALAAVPKNKDVYVICEMGGTLDNKPGTSTGFQSRSLKAMYLLQNAGYSRLYHVKGGLIDWSVEGLPYEEGPPADSSSGSGGSSTKAGAKAEAKESVLAGVFGRR